MDKKSGISDVASLISYAWLCIEKVAWTNEDAKTVRIIRIIH